LQQAATLTILSVFPGGSISGEQATVSQLSSVTGSLGADPFLVLPENRFAYTAIAELMQRPPTQPPRPVFLYGPSGVGKTHLARHCIRQLLRSNSELAFQQATASQYVADFQQVVAQQGLADLSESGRGLDLFVLEDLQGIERRSEVQRQLLALTDELIANGCQVLWTSRKSPGELLDFSPKLVNRLHAGVTAGLSLPGPESRFSLLEHFARARQIAMTADGIRLLTDELAVSPRELLAAVTQLDAQAKLKRCTIDREFVRRFLANEIKPQGIELADIARAVAQHFGIAVAGLRSRSRGQGVVLPRQCAMYLSRELTGMGLQKIGQYYGNRDHSTVVHSCQKVQSLLEEDATLRVHITQIRGALGATPPASVGSS